MISENREEHQRAEKWSPSSVATDGMSVCVVSNGVRLGTPEDPAVLNARPLVPCTKSKRLISRHGRLQLSGRQMATSKGKSRCKVRLHTHDDAQKPSSAVHEKKKENRSSF